MISDKVGSIESCITHEELDEGNYGRWWWIVKSYCKMSGEPLLEGLFVGSEGTKLSEAELEDVRSPW